MIATILTITSWILGLLALSFWVTLRFVRALRVEPKSNADVEHEAVEPTPEPFSSAPKVIAAPAVLFRTSCDECASKFEYRWEHVRGSVTYVRCPSCGARAWHFASNAVRP